MQRTNSEYGTPSLATRHFHFHSTVFLSTGNVLKRHTLVCQLNDGQQSIQQYIVPHSVMFIQVKLNVAYALTNP